MTPRHWQATRHGGAAMHDAGGPALTGPFRPMTALARLDKLFDSSVAGHRLSDYLQGVAWQAGLPMPA